MNGRVYDPALGMFISPDNFVQQPDNTQNFNRYTYCMNNPLMYTDPSGNTWLSHFTGWCGERLSDIDPTKNGTITNNIIGFNIKVSSWFMTSLPSTVDFIAHGDLSRLDPFNKGTISNNSARITMGLADALTSSSFTTRMAAVPGSIISQGYNYIGQVKGVGKFYGATVVQLRESPISISYAMTLGNFIMGDKVATSIQYDQNNRLTLESSVLIHEYGHYLQSRKFDLIDYTRLSINSVFINDETQPGAWSERDASLRGLEFIRGMGLSTVGYGELATWPENLSRSYFNEAWNLLFLTKFFF